MTELSDKPANFLSGIDSFESMFRQHYPFVCNVISKYVIDRSKVEDIAQELFMELWVKKENILIHTSLPAYLRRMAVSRALNYLRDNRKHNWDDIDDTSQHAPDYVAEAPSALQTME
ncbi:MAG TPA: sigma-70 family RNA polymerase sigma factor, partial [Flavobacterium sp.]|nr:sigma-70 family RNA polymerase sigma factor [Flavobacterium sp.]